MRGYIKPRAWKKVPATGGVTFVECKNTRFAFHNDGEDTAGALTALLNRKDREIARLKYRLQEALERS